MQIWTFITFVIQSNLNAIFFSSRKWATEMPDTHQCIHSHFVTGVTNAEIFEQEMQHLSACQSPTRPWSLDAGFY